MPRSADELQPESDSDQSENSNTSFRTTLSFDVFGAIPADSSSPIPDFEQNFAISEQREANLIIVNCDRDKQKADRNEVEDRSCEDSIQPELFATLPLPLLLINDELLTAEDQSRNNKVSSSLEDFGLKLKVSFTFALNRKTGMATCSMMLAT